VRRAERGFTLLELLIALAIVGALLAIALGGVRVAVGAWRRGEARAEAQQHARGVALTLTRAIGGTSPYQARAKPLSQAFLLFHGTASRVALVTQSPPFPFPPSTPIAFTAVVVSLETAGERQGLVIRQRALPNWDPFDEAEVVYHDPAVAKLELAYLDETGAWLDEWKGEEAGVLPRAVRITLGTGPGGPLALLPPITVSLRAGTL